MSYTLDDLESAVKKLYSSPSEENIRKTEDILRGIKGMQYIPYDMKSRLVSILNKLGNNASSLSDAFAFSNIPYLVLGLSDKLRKSYADAGYVAAEGERSMRQDIQSSTPSFTLFRTFGLNVFTRLDI